MNRSGTLIIARHHESVLNAVSRWTGKLDVPLTQYGMEMSLRMGALLQGVHIDELFVSSQMRTHETLLEMLDALQKSGEIITVHESDALNERDYGDYTAMNKWEVKKEMGTRAFDHLRRDFEREVPHGETLKVVYERVVPYYLASIVPFLLAGKNVLVVSSGNAIRALEKYIESISDEDIAKVEMLFGSVLVFTVDAQGKMRSKDVLTIPSQVNA
jgi:2,3-bisphosphoglycerate-dependent phosphoglycerate mutase